MSAESSRPGPRQADGSDSDTDPDPDPVEVTLAAYRDGAGRFLARRVEVGPEMAGFLDSFADLVRPGPVLEIGSGRGQDADHLESRGVQVLRSDATAAYVEALRARGRAATLLDVRSSPLGGPHRGVLADAVLLHLPRAQLATVAARLRAAVLDGGHLALTLKEGDGQAWSEHALGLPRHFTFWREEPLRVLLDHAGWRVLSVDHVAGEHDDWLYVIAATA